MVRWHVHAPAGIRASPNRWPRTNVFTPSPKKPCGWHGKTAWTWPGPGPYLLNTGFERERTLILAILRDMQRA